MIAISKILGFFKGFYDAMRYDTVVCEIFNLLLFRSTAQGEVVMARVAQW